MYVDFHSHILPGADHGSDSLEMSLSQAENTLAVGVDTIVATPHFYLGKDTEEEFFARREAAYDMLAPALPQGLKVRKAAEVQLAPGIEKLPGLSRLCIEGTDRILVEFPPEPWQCWVFDSLTEIIRTRRLRPICAHIDRYSRPGREKILRLNIDVQLNAEALLESRRMRNYYLDLIADDAIHLLGSDTHGDGSLSYKSFSSAVKRIGSLMPFITDNARRIIGDKK